MKDALDIPKEFLVRKLNSDALFKMLGLYDLASRGGGDMNHIPTLFYL